MVFQKLFKNPKGTDEIVHIDDIRIPPCFKKTGCKYFKIERAIDYYLKHKRLDKPITVIAETNEKGFPNKLLLVDQYSRYLACRLLHIDRIPVRYIDIDTYLNKQNM